MDRWIVQHVRSQSMNGKTLLLYISVKTKVTLDSNWRWLHAEGEAVNCYDGNLWDDEFCPDTATCTENCVLGRLSFIWET